MACCGGEEPNKVGAEGEPSSGKFGTPKTFDPNFTGPLKKRSCTDVLCLLIFIIFILAQVIVCGFAFANGDPKRLIAPADSSGHLCGYGDRADRPYLFYFDLAACGRMSTDLLTGKGCPTPKVCLARCPQTTWFFLEAKDRTDMVCLDGTDPSSSSLSIEQLVERKLCAPYVLPSRPVADRCVPEALLKSIDVTKQLATEAGTAITSADNSTVLGKLLQKGSAVFRAVEVAQKIWNDVVRSAWFLLAGCCFAVLVSFLWIVLLRFFTGCMVWITLLSLQVVLIVAAGICFYKAYLVAGKSFKTDNWEFQVTSSGWADLLNYKEIWIALGVVAAVAALILLLLIICLCKRLRLAIALIKQASKAVGGIPSSLAFPLIPFALQLACFALWGATTAFLASATKPQFQTDNATVTCGSTVSVDTVQCHFFKYSGEDWATYLLVFTLFTGLWLLNFVIGFGQITLAGAFASWYWAWEKPKDVPALPVLKAVGRTIRYHLGSVAFGAFLIAVVQFVRILLEYIDHKVRGTENACAKFILCCLKCCLYCLEKCIKFITKNAYIMIAIHGRNFCFSAKDAFFTIMRNILRATVLDGVTTFVMIMGVAIIATAVTTFAFFFFSGQIQGLTHHTPALNYFYVPVILIGLAAIVIAKVFFDVFAFAVDTVFLCAMEDLERNDGSPEKPYFMSMELMELLDVQNKFKSKKKEGCGLCCC